MTLRFKLRTLLILLAVLPPLGAVVVPPLLQWFAAKPVPKIAAPRPSAIPARTFAIYSTGKADAQSIYNLLTQLYAGAPNIRMSLDSSTGSIAVLAPPYLHAELQQIMAMLQESPPAEPLARRVNSSKRPDGTWFPEPMPVVPWPSQQRRAQEPDEL